MKRALQPVISDVSVAWDLAEGWIVNQIPSTLPPLFSGDRLVVYGLLKPTENGSQGGKNAVRLQGTFGNDEKMELLITFPTSPMSTASVTDAEANSGVFLHCLAAKTFIQVKQDDQKDIYNGGQEFEEAKTQIISISKSANVVSKFTSFVAVDKDNHKPVSGPLQRQVVPLFGHRVGALDLDLASNGSVDMCLLLAPTKSASFGFRRNKSAFVAKKKSVKKSKGFPFLSFFGGAASSPPEQEKERKSMAKAASASAAKCDFASAEMECYESSPCARPAPVAAPHREQQKEESPAVLSVISLQKASGAWNLTDQLVSLCGTSRDVLITGSPTELAVDTTKGKLLWATALALVLLMGKFLDQKDEWEMIAEKGKKWMKKNLPATVKCDDVLKSAAAAVGVQIQFSLTT